MRPTGATILSSVRLKIVWLQWVRRTSEFRFRFADSPGRPKTSRFQAAKNFRWKRGTAGGLERADLYSDLCAYRSDWNFCCSKDARGNSADGGLSPDLSIFWVR